MSFQQLLRQHLRIEQLWVMAAITSGFIHSVLTILIPVSIGKYYEIVFHTSSNKGRILKMLGISLDGNITHFFLFFFGIVVLRGVFGTIERYLTNIQGERFARLLREQLFAKQITVSLTQFREKIMGKYLLRYSSDFKSLKRYYSIGILTFVKDVLFFGTSLYFLFHLQVQLTLLLLAALVVFFLINTLLNRKIKDIDQQKRDLRSGLVAFITQRFAAMSAIKSLSRETEEIRKFNRRSERIYTVNRGYQRQAAPMNAMVPTLLYGYLGIMLVYLYVSRADALLSSGELVSYILLLLMLFPTFRRLIKVRNVWRSGQISSVTYNQLLGQTVEQHTEASVEFTPELHSLAWKNLSFYSGKQIRQEFGWQMQIGQINHLQEADTDAVLAVLTGAQPALKGHLILNGETTLAHVAIGSRIAVASYSIPLYGKDLTEALQIKERNIPKAQKLLAKLGVELTEEAFSEPIGDHGNLLSYRERKLLIIARSILSSKPILWLEEPFAGLPVETRYRLWDVLQELIPNRTIVVASLETVPNPVESVS